MSEPSEKKRRVETTNGAVDGVNKHLEAYEPKSMLLTGGAGFIGSNVLHHFLVCFPNTKIVCLDKMDYCSSINNVNDIQSKNFRFVKGDITNTDLVNFLMEEEKFDTVINFAAQTHVDNSFGNSFNFTHSNVFGVHVLLESSKKFQHQIRRFIHVSTDEVYGESQLDDTTKFTETNVLNPTNPYAATKAAAEFMVKAYRLSFKLPTIITRGNNVFGPRQFPEKLIPKFINLLKRDRPLTIHGEGKNRRSFIYVDDVSRAFETVMKYGVPGEIYNIGTDFEITTLDVAKCLLKAFKKEDQEDKLLTFVEDRKFNDLRYHIDLSKLTKLGWEPKISFDEGMKRTIEWYDKHPNFFPDVEAALVAHPRYGLNADPKFAV